MTDPLEPARRALLDGDLPTAIGLLADDHLDDTTAAEGLSLRADAMYRAGDLEGTIGSYESLFAFHQSRGNDIEAAGAAAQVAMHLMMDTGLLSPVRSWLRRVDRLLQDKPETPVHAIQAVVRMYERFMAGDMVGASEWSARAIKLGTSQQVPMAVAFGHTCTGRVAIMLGRVDEGLEELDEVATLLMSGDLDDLPTGMLWCELVCGVQALGLWDRMQEWTETYERWRHGRGFGSIHGRCRVHRAELLRLRGDCDEAEQEALEACEDLRPWMRREFGWPLTELGTIRLRKGDLDGAEEAFLAAHESAWDPQPGLALLRLAQGRADEAASLVGAALDHPMQIPSKERPPSVALRRAPLLEAQTQIAATLHDVATIERAAAELADIARQYPGLRALSALASARAALAGGDPTGAIVLAEQAVAEWVEVGAPWEAANARRVLAAAHEARGNAAQADLERQTAATTFERQCAHWWADQARGDGAEGTRGQVAPTTQPAATAATGEANVFRRDGDTRTATWDGHTTLIADLKGLRYVARLLAEPGREFHVLDLVAVERGALPSSASAGAVDPSMVVSDGGGAGDLLDAQAREAYRRRLVDIEQDIEDALAMHDPERAELARADRDYLIKELSRAVGLGGRPREAGSTAERARTSVTRAIRYGLKRVAEHHPSLAEHLERTVRTGIYCAYEPDPLLEISWAT